MITAIYVKDEAQLTIVTQEDLYLEEMKNPSRRTPLRTGTTPVPVTNGVFKVHSTKPVTVTADPATQVHVAVSQLDKNGTLDPPKAMLPPDGFMLELAHTDVMTFIFPAKGMTAPA